MVIKTETCSFSESRIYPGHGSRYIRRDGTAYIFINAKSKSLFMQRKKPAKIVWTLGWRRMNKKIKVEEVARRRTRKTAKIQKAIVGVSVEDIRKKRNQKPTVRAAAREAALKEAKERSKAKNTVKAEAGKKNAPKGGAAPRAQKKTGNREHSTPPTRRSHSTHSTHALRETRHDPTRSTSHIDTSAMADTTTTTTPPPAPVDAGKEMTSRDYYFDSYSHFGIHEEMLKDTVRTKAYMDAILQSKHLFKDKIVLDVGCGTGILSMFAAKAGAKHVYGVDCSGILTQAKEIVKANGFESQITLIQGKVEELELPVDKVDIIISEWMGYFLLYESMLDTVLYARDKWLVEGGAMFPDHAVLYIGAIEDGEYKAEKIDFWDNVYGFDMSCIKAIAKTEPLVDTVGKDALISDVAPILDIDLTKVTKEELAFESKFQLTCFRQDYCHGLVAYFDCTFKRAHKQLMFSTGPEAEYTHWKQTVFYVDGAIACHAGEVIEGHISCRPNASNPRDLDIALTVDFDGSSATYHQKHEFKLR
ncbi:TPA: hypothetical protein N0F65_011399 [Lagenidium giganteum]|uniref:Uncharacterized protein n=1 Tax=Lagenidium giganteum TaxID=4803 RepID=A0AAV2ZED9_9STRA|nr:TPA: hypothetical protein N0F65_011399 [Lagenidium giganteum]